MGNKRLSPPPRRDRVATLAALPLNASHARHFISFLDLEWIWKQAGLASRKVAKPTTAAALTLETLSRSASSLDLASLTLTMFTCGEAKSAEGEGEEGEEGRGNVEEGGDQLDGGGGNLQAGLFEIDHIPTLA